MKNSIKLFASAIAITFAISSCQKMDRPELGDYLTDEGQVLPGGNLRFFADFNKTDGKSPRWNAADNVSGNPALTFAGGLSYAEDGINGNALKGGDNVALPYLNANDVKSATSLTIAMWLKRTAQAGRTEFLFSLVDQTYGWSNSAAFVLVENQTPTSVTMKFGLMDQWLEGTFTKPIFDGEWHHIAYVYDETTSKMTYYFDGQLVTGMTATQTDVKNGANPRGPLNLTASSKLVLGGWNKHSGVNIPGPTDSWVSSYLGEMDQFRIYNTALSAAEVQSLYANHE